ncbi:deoxynucleotide monophosphate kinase [Pseudomonas aeruginosa]|uniref:deoxynucleotide monophosphate kinase family protein n=1 Tax=Pseudomonas aeruginosa TaxID=287 RepID=UPI001DED656D|nr:deoxynucleotide monophosphate kinase [Pseudomonas aeruginosa]EIU7173476.1 deoxynucleotide monophosphate kinase [Pseudomonas aeruginosa]EKF7418156.1 deoxynucleotide monophosphate kinase [Pseudomonas aeruginosa]EKY1060229.1 deoxynucleotide monophosphate kinase [Pseudomonas aeruginosa]MBM9945122.1 deoxynucleotide monophosphate kinase [Pseudomonas aeruginosa]MCG7004125.1 deoxynucleotide monophosphate kinase [Pseudomonas aeruginosa]
MKPFLIGLTGRARSGKDTAANYLAAQFGLLVYALASPLKLALLDMLNLPGSALEGPAKEQPLPWLGKSPRELMQLLGTEWGRNLVHPQLWLMLADMNLSNHLEAMPQAQGFVISDVRFDNEADWIRAKGGVVVHLRRQVGAEVAAHSSESGITPGARDLFISNDGSLNDLYQTLDEVMALLHLRAKNAA